MTRLPLRKAVSMLSLEIRHSLTPGLIVLDPLSFLLLRQFCGRVLADLCAAQLGVSLADRVLEAAELDRRRLHRVAHLVCLQTLVPLRNRVQGGCRLPRKYRAQEVYPEMALQHHQSVLWNVPLGLRPRRPLCSPFCCTIADCCREPTRPLRRSPFDIALKLWSVCATTRVSITDVL